MNNNNIPLGIPLGIPKGILLLVNIKGTIKFNNKNLFKIQHFMFY